MINKEQAVPVLRFPEFSKDWEKGKLKDVLRTKNKRNYDRKYGKEHVLSVSGDLGVINQIEHLGRSYAGAVVDNYHVIEAGDIVYTKSPLRNNPYGVIKANRQNPGIVSTLYAVYEVTKSNSYDYWDRYFELNDHTNKYLRPLVHKGAKNDMKINNERVLIDPIFIPSLAEQQKIADFFSFIHEKVTLLLHQKQLWMDYKKGCMESLFSQNIRFRTDTGNHFPNWDEIKLGDIAFRKTKKNTDLLHKRVLTNSAVRGVLDQGEYFDKDIANPKNLGGYYIVEKGDFVYNPRISVSAPVGPIKRSEIEVGVMSPLYTVFRFKEKNTDFFKSYFDSYFWHQYMKRVANYGARHDRMAITTTDFMSLPIPQPHPEEQRKISEFLSSIDRKIELVGSELEKAQTFKKGLLQQMFI